MSRRVVPLDAAEAAAPPPRPWYGFDQSNFVPGQDGFFVNNRGQRLHTRAWLPPDRTVPVGVVMFCHGLVRGLGAASRADRPRFLSVRIYY